MTGTTFRIERTLAGQMFLYAQVGQYDPEPLEIEVPADRELCELLTDLEQIGDTDPEILLGTTIRVNGFVSLDNEGEFWTVANTILEMGMERYNNG